MTEPDATIADVTAPTTPSVPRPGLRARASERKVRCNQPKAEDGRRCRRTAGAGTDHVGEGPCSFHGGLEWQPLAFSESVEAQEAFLAAVAADPEKPTRLLIEPLGFHRRDVRDLEAADGEFAARVIEARGYSPERIRHELATRAFGEKGSDRLLELLAKLHLPESEKLRQTRFDGQLEVRAVPYLDLEKLDRAERDELVRLLKKAQPHPEELPRDGRPALELVEAT